MSTVVTPVISKNLYLELSDNNFTDSYTVVCLTKQGMTRSRQVNKKETQCGTLKSRGEADMTLPFEFAVNTTPDALASNVGEASYVKLRDWFLADTALQFRRKHPFADGDDFYEKGTCYISRLDDDETIGDYMTVSGELAIEGEITTVAPGP